MKVAFIDRDGTINKDYPDNDWRLVDEPEFLDGSLIALKEIRHLTEKGVGLGIEAGYAYAKEIPIITIARSGSDISETLEGISKRIFFYNSIEDLEKLL